MAMRLTNWTLYSTRFRIFLPVLAIIFLSISAISYYSIRVARHTVYDSIENYLETEIRSLSTMFEREYELKLGNAQTSLNVIFELFSKSQFHISDQKAAIDIHDIQHGKTFSHPITVWQLDHQPIHTHHDFVDTIQLTMGAKATIFQKTDIGFVRISTNVTDDQGQRAVGTVIPLDSPIAQSVMAGETYFGRAYVVNDWYVTGYGAIMHNNEVIGMLFTGTPEKDLPEISNKLRTIQIGKSGYPFVFDTSGHIIITHPVESIDWKTPEILQAMIEQKTGTLRYLSPIDQRRKIIAFDYFPEFELYIAGFVNKDDETRALITRLITGSILVALLFFIIISVTVYFFTVDKLHHYLEALEDRDQKLASAKNALKQAEKLATMGQLSAGIAHEVNNPLGVVLMYSHLLMEETPTDSSTYKDLEIIATQANRCKSILSGLLNFARKNELCKQSIEIHAFIDSVIKQIILPHAIEFHTHLPAPPASVNLDPAQITQVLINLINNSLDAVSSRTDSPTVTLDVTFKRDRVLFSVSDNGPGIQQENQTRVFEPFFSTKQIGKGTGLGLAVCYGIVKMHQGEITVTSNDDCAKGPTFTQFTVSLPVE
jgi:signal transduction histidine kinase